jgi:hypothetical protein
MYSDTGDTTSLVPGFPIRTSSDPRSVDSSPRHIAASHVLHRLSMPRHPPCALKHLQTQKPTIDKKSKLHILDQHTTNTKPAAHRSRCSQPLSNYQTPHPTTKQGDTTHPSHTGRDNSRCCLRTQQCAGSLACLQRDECCCAPGRRHYSARPLHGFRCGPVPQPFSWCSLERR